MASYNTHPSVYLNSPNQYKKYQKISYKIFLRYLSVEPGEKSEKMRASVCVLICTNSVN